MLDIGLSELLIILAVALIVLGPKKLPEIARSLGRGLAEFRRTSEDLRRSIFLEEEEADKPDFREHPPESSYSPSPKNGAAESSREDRAKDHPTGYPSPPPDERVSSEKNGDKG